jgi:hypothetical protein
MEGRYPTAGFSTCWLVFATHNRSLRVRVNFCVLTLIPMSAVSQLIPASLRFEMSPPWEAANRARRPCSTVDPSIDHGDVPRRSPTGQQALTQIVLATDLGRTFLPGRDLTHHHQLERPAMCASVPHRVILSAWRSVYAIT